MCILLSLVSLHTLTGDKHKKRCRHPSHAFTQAASEWKPDPTIMKIMPTPFGEDINYFFVG